MIVYLSKLGKQPKEEFASFSTTTEEKAPNARLQFTGY